MIKLEDHYDHVTERPGQLYALGKDVSSEQSFDGTALDKIWYDQVWHIAHLPFRFNNTQVDGQIETGTDTDQYQVEFEKMINSMQADFLENNMGGKNLGKSGAELSNVYATNYKIKDVNAYMKAGSNPARIAFTRDGMTGALEFIFDSTNNYAALSPIDLTTTNLGGNNNSFTNSYITNMHGTVHFRNIEATRDIKDISIDSLTETVDGKVRFNETALSSYIKTETDEDGNEHKYFNESDFLRNLVIKLVQEVNTLKGN